MTIPDDVIIQVLKELPVKSLLRLRCVSKRWLSIIDDPYFVCLHRERSHSRAGGVTFLIKIDCLYRPYLYNPVSRLLSLSPPAYYCTGYDSWMCAEGLLLFSDQIWNLSTKKRIYYPPLPLKKRPRGARFHLGFDRLSKEYKLVPVRYFLGFDPLSKGYKLVSVYFARRSIIENQRLPLEEKRVAEILTLGTNSWRSIVDVSGVIPGDHPIWGSNHSNPMICCCINGTLYIYLKVIKRASAAAAPLITFDLGCEKFRLIPLPEEDTGHEFQIRYDSRGNLFLLRFYYLVRKRWTWGWKLEDARSGTWKPQKSINCSNFSTRFCPDLLDATTVPELNELLQGRPFQSCQTVETLFQTNNS